VQHVSIGFTNFDEFYSHWMMSPQRHLSTLLSQPRWTDAAWYSLVHRGLSLTDCSGYLTPCCTPRQWNGGTCKYNRGLSQLLHTDLHWLDVADEVWYKLVPPVSAQQSAKVPDGLLCRCLGYHWSSETALSTLLLAGCTALSTNNTRTSLSLDRPSGICFKTSSEMRPRTLFGSHLFFVV